MEKFALLGDPASAPQATNDTAALLEPAALAQLGARISDQSLVPPGPLPAPDTPAASHISVIDPYEVYVSLVSGVGAFFGSKFRSTSGIVFNNAMSAFYDPAQASTGTLNLPLSGRRPLTSVSPAILMAPKVCGQRVVTGGSDASLLTQAVIRLADPRENLTSSLEAPRLHTSPDSVQLGIEEDRPLQFSSSVLRSLEAMGHETRGEEKPYPSCNGITKNYDQLSSHSDSRGGGTAVRF
ncbi:glutathione hydrolase proenzyme-like [Pollicipes pollicipes]|uniref:glutathione hydrolase proenzyme-like n=1 Tax=Pollicipes pollicipes TaxID=41117 RepID=UPI001885156C|nr:glutathione hydrolase proenzyme-like [Pollicipes pollicipes]